MCFLCVRTTAEPAIGGRDEALALLARLERPGALSRAEALRLGARLLAWSESEGSRLRCDAVEETAQGADAMIGDGLAARIPKPDIALAQHVIPAPAGAIGWRTGLSMAMADSWEVKLFGRGAHGSQPQKSIDPVVMAASAVMHLQGVVAREVAMTDSAVVTVGTLHAGTNENVIPDEALLRLNVRTAARGRVGAARVGTVSLPRRVDSETSDPIAFVPS